MCNTFFKEKVTKLQEKVDYNINLAESYMDQYVSAKNMPNMTFSFSGVTRNDVIAKIRSLKNTGAEGIDGISTLVLKKFAIPLSGPLTCIVNRAVMQARYPTRWKEGIISPLPKSGDLTSPQNWRPVVINCAASKVLEGFLNDQMTRYLDRGWSSLSQHAYRANRSCNTALQDLDTFIGDSRNRGKAVALVLTDMSAAFNIVKSEMITMKLAKMGFDKHAIKMSLLITTFSFA